MQIENFEDLINKTNLRGYVNISDIVKGKNYDKEKRMVISIAFCDFALWNSDHRNLGLVFPKFLFFWAEWNV